MATIIDSLFLELGIDTSKFSADEQRALAKIAEFEKRSKKGAKGAAGAVKTVGQAFRKITDDSAIGTSTKRLDSFALKLKSLGQAAQVSGGVGTPLGNMAEGLGMLLSPAALGIAALALLGKGVWDLNEKMTATNATIYRQAQLSGMSAKNLWAYGEAARAVGAQPQDITGGIAALQTAVTGMGIGAGNAMPQLIAAARLGVGWNFKTGIDIPQLFERVHQLAAQNGYQNLGALRALSGPLMNDAMWNVATNPTYDPAKFQSYIKSMEPAALGAVLQKSLQSQTILGKLGIRKDILAETAYGGTQGPMQALVTLMTSLLALTNKLLAYTIEIATDIANILNFIRHPFNKQNPVAKDIKSHIQKDLIAKGVKPKTAAQAAATVTPLVGQAAKNDFELAGKEMLAPFVFAKDAPALAAAEIVKWLYSKPKAANKPSQGGGIASRMSAAALVPGTMVGLEIFGTPADISGYLNMMAAVNSHPRVTHNTTTHQTKIGDVHVHTPATDPKAHAAAVRKGLSTHPLIDPTAQHQVTLSTTAVAG